MKRLLLVGGGLVVAIAVLGAAAAAVIGPARLLDRAGYAAAESRLVTGIAVAGTAESPVIYVSSSDPRIPLYLEGERLPIDTNSGVLSALVEESSGWARRDLVLGLPRSPHDHATNGLALDGDGGTLYVAQGSMTNMGAPSMRFDGPEYRLSASILAVDLDRLGDGPYALPTLGDETDGGAGRQDPFGGNGGATQTVLESGGPISMHATGFRNPYDLVLTRRGALFATDNGPNWFWGDPPTVSGGRCADAPNEGGRYVPDSLALVERGRYYGHPNPSRAGECAYRKGTAATLDFDTSTNGLAEYPASNFGGALAGDLLATSFDHRLYRIDLDASGRRVLGKAPLAEIEGFPLDLTTQSDDAPFPGTVWIADWLSGDLVVLEPVDRRSGAHWQALAPSGFRRQEVAWTRVGDRFYLAGGDRRHEAYDPASDTWDEVAPLPRRLDHIQGVAVDGRAYYIGGLVAYPEPAVGTVSIYDPRTDTFSEGAPMPRPRGAGGVAVHGGKIYYAGGLSDGRAVPWFDVYDPATDSWSELPDMPRARDHFQAQVVGARFYAIGGRDSDVDANLAESDAYDVDAGSWVTGLAPLPTPRGGYASAVVGDEILLFGGEASDRVFAEVEAYDVRRDTWRALEPMSIPRHGIQAIACDGDVFVAAGGEAPFGDEPSNVNSVYVTMPSDRCPLIRAGAPRPADVAFRMTRVATGLANPTSLQFGPDARLYVAEQDGTVAALRLHRTDAGTYELLELERIEAIRAIPNHNDDGSPVASWSTFVRQVGIRLGLCCSYARGAPQAAADRPTRPASGARGRTLFRDAGCVGCHAFAPAGSTAVTGPPLDARRKLPAAYLERAIVDPDAAIVPGYLPGQMPPDYGASLSRQQLADIVAFIREGG